MARTRSLILTIGLLAVAFAGCSDDDQSEPTPTPDMNPAPEPEPEPEPEPDMNPEPTPDMFTGDFAAAKATEVDDEMTFEALKYPVHVTFDGFGVPHILAESIEDAVYVQGYLHGKDRVAQMELIRGLVTGKLARAAGALDRGVIDDDIEQRMLGFARVGQEIYDSYEEGSPSKRLIDAYTAGVNHFLQRLRDGNERIPNEVRLLVKPSSIRDWTPVDSLGLVRFQQFDLSFDAPFEIRVTRNKLTAESIFSPDSEDPALAARAGIFDDLHRWAPADATFQIPDFTAPREREKRGEAPEVEEKAYKAPSMRTLDIAERFAKQKRSKLYRSLVNNKGMSNSWAVSGSMTESGNPIIANDPHLGLDSPALFHEVHMVVEPREEADGPDLNVFGAQFPGLPGILIGHNEHIAWALTTASYDYTDAFREQLVWRDGEDWPRVMHNGEEVELEIVTEEIEVGGGLGGELEIITIEYPIVPHRRGPLALEIRDGEVIKPEGDEAISYAWRGFSASDEVKALLGMMTADNVDEANDALDDWVIGSQNMLFADTSGNIFTTGKSYIPNRPAETMTWDPIDNPQGRAPWMILEGTGEHDWIGPLDFEQVPHVLNPEAGFIVTANNDQTGMTEDNNMFNDPHPYLGYDYDLGFRAGRIERMVTNADGNREGKITVEDMARYQGDTRSDNDERITPFMLEALGRALDEYESPDTHADLTPILAEHPEAAERLAGLVELLEGWDFVSEDGIFGEPTADQIKSANATSLFNFWQSAIVRRAFYDEFRATEFRFSPTSQQISKGLIFLLEHPEQTSTLDPETGQSAIWDDLETPEVNETRDATIIAALFDALAELSSAFESDEPGDWLWGAVHQRTFESIIPSLAPGIPHAFTMPQPDEGFGEGYPTKGDNYNVNVCNGGVTDFRFSCGGGAILRLLVELDPEGIRSWNAMPGGQVWNKTSPNFRDQLDLWLNNERKPNPFLPDDVLSNVESHTLFTP